jgi:membrane protein
LTAFSIGYPHFMARGKTKKRARESGLERWVGTVLTTAVLAKLAFSDHNRNGSSSGVREAPASAAPSPEKREQAPPSDAADGHGRGADSPTEIPAAGWKDIVWRAAKQVKEDSVPLLSGGVAFYALLALFPALIALVSIYGLVASPEEVATQLRSITRAMPAQARDLIITQLTALANKPDAGLGISAVISIIVALWSASSGMRWLMTALTTAYDEEETRKFVRLRGTALVLTLGAIIVGVVMIGLLVAAPSVFRVLGIESTAKAVMSVLRWPILAGLVMAGLSILYRYGPDRDDPKWRWVTPGAILATFVWFVASVGFSVYTSLFGRFDRTYGALGAVIVLMLWLFLSGFAVMLGAEVNAEIERQTMDDSTVGPEAPMGARHATAADELGAARPVKAG